MAKCIQIGQLADEYYRPSLQKAIDCFEKHIVDCPSNPTCLTVNVSNEPNEDDCNYTAAAFGGAGHGYSNSANGLIAEGRINMCTVDELLEPCNYWFLERVMKHELAHLMYVHPFISGWVSQISNGTFTGPQATAVFQAAGGVGSPPVTSDVYHWDGSVILNTMVGGGAPTPRVQDVSPTTLDVAAMADVGWCVDFSGAVPLQLDQDNTGKVNLISDRYEYGLCSGCGQGTRFIVTDGTLVDPDRSIWAFGDLDFAGSTVTPLSANCPDLVLQGNQRDFFIDGALPSGNQVCEYDVTLYASGNPEPPDSDPLGTVRVVLTECAKFEPLEQGCVRNLGELCKNTNISVQMPGGGTSFSFVSGGTAGLSLSPTGLVTGVIPSNIPVGAASFTFTVDGQNCVANYTINECGQENTGCTHIYANGSQTGSLDIALGMPGDFAYAYVTATSPNGGGNPSTAPAGWTIFKQFYEAGTWRPHVTIFKKVLTSGDIGSTVDFSGTSNGAAGVSLVVYRNVTNENFIGWNDGWNGNAPPVSLTGGTLGSNTVAVMSGHDQGNYSPWEEPSTSSMVANSTTVAGEFRSSYVAESQSTVGGTWTPNDPTGNSNWVTSSMVITCTGGVVVDPDPDPDPPGGRNLGNLCIGELMTPFQLPVEGSGQFNYQSGGSAGLNLSPTGLVTGTPSTANPLGPASFVYSEDGTNYTVNYTLVECDGDCVDLSPVTWCAGTAVNTVLQPSGNGFIIVSGLPAGVTLSGSTLSGTPTSVGSGTITYRANGSTKTCNLSWSVIECSNNCGVYVLGDSISEGTQNNLGFDSSWTVNALSGRPLASGTPPNGLTLLQNITPTNPNDVLIIELGTNDSFTNADVGAYPGQISQAITTAKGNGWSNIVWVNTYRDDQFGSPADTVAFNNALVATVGSDPDVTICDWYSVVQPSPGTYLSDGTHPNNAGRIAFKNLLEGCAAVACGGSSGSCQDVVAEMCIGEAVNIPLLPEGVDYQIYGTLPAGLSFSATNDAIQGTPTTASSGAIQFGPVSNTVNRCFFTYSIVECSSKTSFHLIV